ncbi:hypothetical protein BS333_13025 [Vibrio azureus]|uniref:Uncharacterized protein n=1 Tax=Vibrio azureus NBRC 104587 TaxID=1219077 RepID=U3ASU4_9VIBR|nr:hypothetical protein [Vibrio azureus]AUI87214.1 hypothetical protein BS333_13025 [Vibrio azureus]GAD76820.1 hypothetical protein VAZ01S_053_00390 [Vibrio azureus NBRC 104587]
MFKNKHVIIALLVAPLLSVIAYFGIDLALSEKPHAAQAGQSYKLASQSNCRYTSGLCDMKNGEFKVRFRSEKLTEDQLQLSLSTDYPIEGVKLSIVDDPDHQPLPIEMTKADSSHQQWYVTLNKPQSAASLLRVVIQSNGTLYYGETQTPFVKYETLFTEETEN